MDYGDYYWGLIRGYYKDPVPHSLLSTRQFFCTGLCESRLDVSRLFSEQGQTQNGQKTPNPEPYPDP